MEIYQIFNQTPDWSGGIQLRYSYLTTLTASQRYLEQRKAMRDIPLRSESFSIYLDLKAPEIFNYIIACLQKVMLVPIFSEVIKNFTTGVDATTLLTNDISKYFNIQTMPANVLIVGAGWQEVRWCVPGPSSIDVTPKIDQELLGNEIIYPLILAKLNSLSKTFESEKRDTYKLEFDEFVEEGILP